MANIPGPKNIIAGTSDSGFFGEVLATDFFTGVQLQKKIGLNLFGEDNLENKTPWLKFIHNGKILYKLKRYYLYIGRKTLDDIGALYGQKIIEDNNGNFYKVRVMSTVNEDPLVWESLEDKVKDSEWNSLIIPLLKKNKENSFMFPHLAENSKKITWDINYTDEDLATDKYKSHLCMEFAPDGYSLLRGYYDASYISYSSSSGWSPVLELVPQKKILLRHTKTGKIYTIKEGSFS